MCSPRERGQIIHVGKIFNRVPYYWVIDCTDCNVSEFAQLTPDGEVLSIGGYTLEELAMIERAPVDWGTPEIEEAVRRLQLGL